MKQIGWFRTVLISLKVLPKLFTVWLHTSGMTGKWPREFNEEFMDVPLKEIRVLPESPWVTGIGVVREAACAGRFWEWAACSAAG